MRWPRGQSETKTTKVMTVPILLLLFAVAELNMYMYGCITCLLWLHHLPPPQQADVCSHKISAICCHTTAHAGHRTVHVIIAELCATNHPEASLTLHHASCSFRVGAIWFRQKLLEERQPRRTRPRVAQRGAGLAFAPGIVHGVL